MNPPVYGGLLFRIWLSLSLNSSEPGLNSLILYTGVQKIASNSEIIAKSSLIPSFFFVCWHFGI